MALVGKPSLQSNPGKRLIGPAHQGLSAFETALHDVTLWTDPKRQLERATEVEGTKTGHSGEIGQTQPITQMSLDVVTHPLQPLAGQPARRHELYCRRIDIVPHDPHCQRGAQRIGEGSVEDPVVDLIGYC